MKRLIQATLRRFGYQLVRNTRPRPLAGVRAPDIPLSDALREELRPDHPRLVELRRRYEQARLPMLGHTWWSRDYVESNLDLSCFRGDNAYVWQQRHLAQCTGQRYYLYARDVAARDGLGLFERLSEDGSFGCWVHRFHRFPALSRDLLDSVNELNFLERHAGLTRIPALTALDIGAGYGRLAHRCSEAWPGLAAYFCVDAIPESTFLSEWYLRHRGITRAHVVAVDELASLDDVRPQLALNVHSFSEMPLSAIDGWLDLLDRLQVPRLFVVPNDAEAFLTMEADGTRRDYLPAVERRGYRVLAQEPAIADPDTRELVGVHDHLFLFERRT